MYGRREKAGGFDRVGQRLHSLLDSRRICCTAGIGARERRRARNERHARMYAPLIATMIATYTQIIHNDSRWDGWIEEGSAEGDRVSSSSSPPVPTRVRLLSRIPTTASDRFFVLSSSPPLSSRSKIGIKDREQGQELDDDGEGWTRIGATISLKETREDSCFRN